MIANYIFRISLLFVVFPFYLSHAQTVVGSAGDYYATANEQFSWTIGESIIESYSLNGDHLTQGFHQGLYVIISIEEHIIFKGVEIFPNPTSENISIRWKLAPIKWEFKLIDISGKILNQMNFSHVDTDISVTLSHLPVGIYLVQLTSENQDQFQQFKISKTH